MKDRLISCGSGNRLKQAITGMKPSLRWSNISPLTLVY